MVNFLEKRIESLLLSGFVFSYNEKSGFQAFDSLSCSNILYTDKSLHSLCNQLNRLGSELLAAEEPVELTGTVDETSQDIPVFKLTDDQQKAWDKIQAWVVSNERYFTLRGYAGAGKTTMVKFLRTLPNLNLYFTAPTNKATKELEKSVGTAASTIYSLLKIRMVESEDSHELTFSSEPLYLGSKPIIVIDEASQLNSTMVKHVNSVCKGTGARVIYVGDPAQLPPVGEHFSPAWDMPKGAQNKALLKQIVRYENSILEEATRVRELIKLSDPRAKSSAYVRKSTFTEEDGGVIVQPSKQAFIDKLVSLSLGDFDTMKAVAWKNVTVDKYNSLVRDALGFKDAFEVGDRVRLAVPFKIGDAVAATVDTEFEVKSVVSSFVNVDTSRIRDKVPVWEMVCFGEPILTLSVPKDPSDLDVILSELSSYARSRREKSAQAEAWKSFWQVKDSFHSVRYSYAITAHRAQGSTLNTVFVDQQDILSNQEPGTALSCLYVAITRASKWVYTY